MLAWLVKLNIKGNLSLSHMAKVNVLFPARLLSYKWCPAYQAHPLMKHKCNGTFTRKGGQNRI